MAPSRILLVEDEPTVRDLLENVLLGEGYLVDVASTFGEAMRWLGGAAYSLVITDWRLPDGDGTLIADKAVETGAKSFVMSGYLFQMSDGGLKQHETLMKPLRPNELVAAVERRIGKVAGR